MGDHADHSPPPTAYLERIEQAKIVACTIDTVVFEAVFALSTFYQMPRSAIQEALVPLIQLPGLRLSHRNELVEAIDLLVEHRRLSFADCYHAVRARRLNSPELVSFDRGNDKLSRINRTEPS